MSAIIAFGFGVLIGSIIVMLIFRRFIVGNLRIDRSDPSDPPYTFLELTKDFRKIENKSHVILRVRVENFIPHK